MNEKIDFKIQQLQRDKKKAKEELFNENSTNGTIRSAHLEIEKIDFCIKILNFLKND